MVEVPGKARVLLLAKFSSFTAQLKSVSTLKITSFQYKSDQLMSLMIFQRLTLAGSQEI
jgi:hypothetical protein